jgi:hypothetical protein
MRSRMSHPSTLAQSPAELLAVVAGLRGAALDLEPLERGERRAPARTLRRRRRAPARAVLGTLVAGGGLRGRTATAGEREPGRGEQNQPSHHIRSLGHRPVGSVRLPVRSRGAPEPEDAGQRDIALEPVAGVFLP